MLIIAVSVLMERVVAFAMIRSVPSVTIRSPKFKTRQSLLIVHDKTPSNEATETQTDEATEAPVLLETPVAEEPNIIEKYIKPRDDWWIGKNPNSAGPIDAIVQSVPLPSYAWLLSSTVGAIAFIGCIFQLFYNKPPAPVLGVPLTTVILIVSGPTFLGLFLLAIAKGQKESEEDDARYM